MDSSDINTTNFNKNIYWDWFKFIQSNKSLRQIFNTPSETRSQEYFFGPQNGFQGQLRTFKKQNVKNKKICLKFIKLIRTKIFSFPVNS